MIRGEQSHHSSQYKDECYRGSSTTALEDTWDCSYLHPTRLVKPLRPMYHSVRYIYIHKIGAAAA